MERKKTNMDQLLLVYTLTETKPTTPACDLIGNQTSDLSL